jgi:hypothetical protein
VLAAVPLLARAEQTVTSTETVIKLTARPAAAPKPALRYLLLPELKEMTQGNPIPNYLRCLLEEDFSNDRQTLSRSALRQADRAARMDRPDWQILPKLKTDGVGLLIPDVQKVRALAAALQERFRAEVAEGRCDDALVTAKTMFAMSRHMSEHPTLIGDLVGIAIAFVTISPLEDLLEQPGCPNLYWALTNLPSPLVPLDRGMEGERMFVQAELRDLDDRAPMSEDRLKKVIAHVDKLLEFDKSKNARAWVEARVKDEKAVAAARGRLVEAGLPGEAVKQFPAAQVILQDEKREFEARRDEFMKLITLPAWQFEAEAARVNPSKEPGLFDSALPAMLKVRRALGRLEQRVALLRHVEALRLYAAAHGGKLPEKLADVPVPLPSDPFTGKPFAYKAEGNTAHVRGGPPPGEEKNAAYNVRYELTIQK